MDKLTEAQKRQLFRIEATTNQAGILNQLGFTHTAWALRQIAEDDAADLRESMGRMPGPSIKTEEVPAHA